MRVAYLPVLRQLRALYSQPRDMHRFRTYIQMLTGGTDDVVLPIGVANPMAKEQAVARIDELLALGAEAVGAEAAAQASVRLTPVHNDLEIKASLVLVDDVGGGWTNRYTSEASARFPSRGALKRPFASGLVWTSESPTAERLRAELLAAIYRVAHHQQHGLPTTLAAMLEQEGLAGAFAGARPNLGRAELAAARARIGALAPDAPYPQIFACLYGNTAAIELGYPPLGLPARAGFEVALADALDRAVDPVTVLG